MSGLHCSLHHHVWCTVPSFWPCQAGYPSVGKQVGVNSKLPLCCGKTDCVYHGLHVIHDMFFKDSSKVVIVCDVNSNVGYRDNWAHCHVGAMRVCVTLDSRITPVVNHAILPREVQGTRILPCWAFGCEVYLVPILCKASDVTCKIVEG